MPEDEFTFAAEDFVRRIVLFDKIRKVLLLIAAVIALLAFAVVLSLTGTLPIVITLTIVGIVIYQVVRIGIVEHRRETS